MDEEKKRAIEVIYEPNKPDLHGDWMSEETLRKACENFNHNYFETKKVKPNLFHLQETDKVSVVKTWINEVECKIGDYIVPEGSWLGEFQYHDDTLWEKRKNMEIRGVSIGARGVPIPPSE